MKNIVVILAIAILALLFPQGLKAQNKIDAQIVLETSSPHPQQTMRLALKMDPQPGWHGYWENPGEGGMAVNVNWTLPKGVTISNFQHSSPVKLQTGGITSYVHEGPYTLLAYLSIPQNFQTEQEVEIKGDFIWAACSDSLCTFEKKTLYFKINVSKNPNTPLNTAAFNKIEAQIPQKLRHPGKLIEVEGGIEIHLPIGKGLKPQDANIFLINNDIVSPSAIPVVTLKDDSLVFAISAKYKNLPEAVIGIVSDKSGTRGYAFLAKKTKAPFIKEELEVGEISEYVNDEKIAGATVAQSAPKPSVESVLKTESPKGRNYMNIIVIIILGAAFASIAFVGRKKILGPEFTGPESEEQ